MTATLASESTSVSQTIMGEYYYDYALLLGKAQNLRAESHDRWLNEGADSHLSESSSGNAPSEAYARNILKPSEW